MGNVVLSDVDQGILVIVSILLLLVVIAVIYYISCKRYSRLERRLWRDIERDFVMIGSPAHMAEIKKSESDMSCQALLYSNTLRPSISSPGLPQSPPPAYHLRKSTEYDNSHQYHYYSSSSTSLVDVKI